MATVSFGRTVTINKDWGAKNIAKALREAESRNPYVRPAELDTIREATDDDLKIIFSRVKK